MGANINQTLFSAAFWCFRVSRLHFVFEIKEKLQYQSSFSTYTSLFLPLEGKGEKNATHNLKFGVISKF